MLQLKNISFAYGEHKLFSNFSLTVNDGDFIAIVGKSGSGKSTLLNIMALLEPVQAGKILINGRIYSSERQKLLYHRHKLSFLWQNYALIDGLSVEENLALARRYANSPANLAHDVDTALTLVNLPLEVKWQKVYELSGGEQQRVALARLLLKDAEFILADEPTGNLDRENSEIVFRILQLLNEQGKTIIMVTHDLSLARRAKQILQL